MVLLHRTCVCKNTFLMSVCELGWKHRWFRWRQVKMPGSWTRPLSFKLQDFLELVVCRSKCHSEAPGSLKMSPKCQTGPERVQKHIANISEIGATWPEKTEKQLKNLRQPECTAPQWTHKQSGWWAMNELGSAWNWLVYPLKQETVWRPGSYSWTGTKICF